MSVPADPESTPVNPDLLWRYVEQPEPSVNGDWFIIPLETLIREGFTHVEIHFDYDKKNPNMARLTKDPNWHSEIL